MIEIPHGLKEAIEADDLVLFIGAGLSWNLKNTKNEPLEGWDKMVKSILSHLNEKGYITDEEKLSCDKPNPIDTLQELENRRISRREVGEFVKYYFTLKEENDLSFHQKLFSLSTKIITTNYDRAFEKAVPELQEIKAYRTKDYELNRLKKDSVFLFKLHGCIEHIDSMVLFPSDYDKLYKSEGREAEHTLHALRNLIFNKTFLFIGTGLGDPQINGIFKEIKRTQGIYNQEHYIITLDSLDDSLNFLTSIQVASHDEIPKVIDQLVAIKQEAEAKKSSEKKKLLDQLKESEKEIDSLSEQLAQVQDKTERQALLLAREANNHFNIGVKYHLAGEYLEASKEYEAATVLNPKYSAAYNNWGVVLSELAKTKSGSEAEALCKAAFEKYHQATLFKQDYPDAYNNWGLILSVLAETKSGSAAEELYKESCAKYKKSTSYKPDFPGVYYNWGNALYKLAQIKSGSESKKLYEEAAEKYHQATLFKPDYHDAYNNWGVALYGLVQTKTGSEAEELYEAAFGKCQQAIQYKPDDYAVYSILGNILYELAEIKSNSEAEKLYNEAIDKYEQVIKYKPDFYQIYKMLGVVLIQLELKKSGNAAEQLYNEVFRKYREMIDQGGYAYNLAWLYAIKNKKEEALKYLERSLERGEISVDFVEKDTDWDGLRDDSDFKNLLSRYKEGNRRAIQ
nr:SIR2 family protein [uncultured Prevotella sp.]